MTGEEAIQPLKEAFDELRGFLLDREGLRPPEELGPARTSPGKEGFLSAPKQASVEKAGRAAGEIGGKYTIKAEDIAEALTKLHDAVVDLIEDSHDAFAGKLNEIIQDIQQARSIRSPNFLGCLDGIAEGFDHLAGEIERIMLLSGGGAARVIAGPQGLAIDVDDEGQPGEGDSGSDNSSGVFRVDLAQADGVPIYLPTLLATWRYTVTNSLTGDTLGLLVDPMSSPHYLARNYGYTNAATHGTAFLEDDGTFVLIAINEYQPGRPCV